MNAIEPKQILIDPRAESYRTFFDHAWARSMHELVSGSKLLDPVFNLCLSWKASVNAHVLPWLMVDGIRKFFEGYLQGQATATEQLVFLLSQSVPKAMADSLSHMNRKKLAGHLTTLGNAVRQEQRVIPPELDPQFMFQEMISAAAGHELQLSILGVERSTYGSICHAYENFVTECVGLARGEPEYRPFPVARLIEHTGDVFGAEVAAHCLSDPAVETIRLVRNSLAHHGGRIKGKLASVDHGICVVDGELQIMPEDNRRMFGILKQRAYRLTERAREHPLLKRCDL